MQRSIYEMDLSHKSNLVLVLFDHNSLVTSNKKSEEERG